MEKIIEHSKAKITILGKVVEVPMVTETIKHDDNRQDVVIHLPTLSTIAGEQNGKRDI